MKIEVMTATEYLRRGWAIEPWEEARVLGICADEPDRLR